MIYFHLAALTYRKSVSISGSSPELGLSRVGKSQKFVPRACAYGRDWLFRHTACRAYSPLGVSCG